MFKLRFDRCINLNTVSEYTEKRIRKLKTLNFSKVSLTYTLEGIDSKYGYCVAHKMS